MSNRKIFLGVLLGGWLLQAPAVAWAQGSATPARSISARSGSGTATPLSLQAALRSAMAHNPALRAAVYDLRSAEQTLRAEDNRYLPVLQLDLAATRQQTPTLTVLGGVSVASGDSATGGAQLSHLFPWGTSTSVRLEGNANRQTLFLNAASTEALELGPGYGLNARVSVNQPLLRGFGRAVGELERRVARHGRTAAEQARDVAAGALLRDVLVAYCELRHAGRTQAISEASLALAERRHDEASQRITAGALPEAERLQFETRVLDARQALAESRLSRRRQALSLSALLGQEPVSANLLASDSLPEPEPEPGVAIALAQALANAPDLGQLQAELDQARERARVAGEEARPRLDLEAYVQAGGLGNKELSPALSQLTGLSAVSAHVGLVYEFPVNNRQRTALRVAARKTAAALSERVRGRRLEIESNVRDLLETAATARQRRALAQQAAVVAEQQQIAQQQRYEAGTIIALEVHEAEDAFRQAQLSLARAETDLVEAQLQLQHLTGALLARHASLLAE